MNLDNIPIFDALKNSKRILISGAGGGFDIFCGLPLFLCLKNMGKDVLLANLSFSDLESVTQNRLSKDLVKITADSDGSSFYFPEKYLCEWFRLHDHEASIFGFHRNGVVPLTNAYKFLITKESIDTVVLVDGGTDSLMKGDEIGLGTPYEDMCSIAAVDELSIPNKFLICLGFGVDVYHGVSHGLFLQNVAELTQKGQFLGTFSLLPQMECAQQYRDASNYVFNKMPNNKSIVTSSILSSIAGEFGNYHATERTSGSMLWINPLMSIYWCFYLDGIARNSLYLDRIKKTTGFHEFSEKLKQFRLSTIKLREWENIPL
jgi:hypothetical protein